ncbi:MAG: 4-hydroxy-tetrahydrodipicolinate synthase [Actinobacteria bacterium]|nr:4-hydroxy-tetrahydrodipicolinate synthase [Actinomycetota bacterium]
MEWGLKGVIVPLITPFNADMSVDWTGLRRLVDYYVEEIGCDGVVPCGTTGESPTLSHAEHAEVIRVVIDQTNRRVPVIAGAGSNSTQEAIELTKAAKEAGADATLQVCPYYNKPTQEGIFRHFQAISEAAGLPVIVYNIPGRTGRNIEPSTIIRMWAEIPQVVGLKDASGDLQQAMAVLADTDRASFQVYSGEDIMTFALLCHGSAGAIAAVAHVVGREVKEMCSAVWSGDLTRARELHFQTMPVVEALFVEPNPAPVKQALEWMGLPAGPLRPPLEAMTERGQAVLRTALEAGGWI